MALRPLDRIPSIKLKLGILIVVAVVVSATVSTFGFRLGWPVWVRPVISVAIALLFVQVLARGMTRPLRDMAHAATRMRRGEYDHVVATDATDEVGQLADAFNAMAQELATTDRLRRDLVANASHELWTPLAGMRATLENLVDGVTPTDEVAVEGLLDQVNRMSALVEQLLDLSRLESGAAGLASGPVDLSAVARSVVGDLTALAEHQQVTLTVEVTAAANAVVVPGDPVRLRQVVANLISNALRHTPAGGVVRVVVADSGQVVVHDDGPGISSEDSERVFERFYRADRARGSSGGAGLGLAICRWIVDLHGGRIAHDPTAPGCRMVMDLPTAPP